MRTNSSGETISLHDQGEDLPRMGGETASPAISAEPVNDASGTTWMGMRAVGWTWDDPAPAAFGGTLRKFATHWSTGPKDAERLYRESDVRALIAALSPKGPSSTSGGGDRDEAMLSLLKEARNSLCALLPNPGEPDLMLALSRSNTADNEELRRALRAVRRAIASLTNPTEVSP